MRILKNANLMIVGMVLLFVAGVLAASSYAKIDPETCVGMWLFDEGNGDIAKDSSGNENDGTLVGDPKWVDGKFGSALEFGASANDVVKVPHKDDLTLESYSLLAWVQIPKVSPKSQGIITKDGWPNRN